MCDPPPSFVLADRGLSAFPPIGLCSHTSDLLTTTEARCASRIYVLHPEVILQATYTYSLPYTATFLPDGPLSYPVKLWVNSEHNMVRLDTYDSLDSELHRDVCSSSPCTCALSPAIRLLYSSGSMPCPSCTLIVIFIDSCAFFSQEPLVNSRRTAPVCRAPCITGCLGLTSTPASGGRPGKHRCMPRNRPQPTFCRRFPRNQ